MFSIRIVTTLEEFSTLGERWNSLLGQCTSENIFLTWEWLYTWAKHYLGGNQLRIILVYKGNDQLVGIAPFYIQRVTKYGLCHLREMQFLGTQEVCSSYLDVIVPEKYKKDVLYHMYQHLHGDARALWDILTLSEIPAESSTIDLWDGFIEKAGKVLEIVGITGCPVIKLSSSIEDFLAGISRNERYNLQRKHKRLEQAGHVTYDRASSVQDVEKRMETLISLHQMRWKRKGNGGAFGSQLFISFHREVALVLAKKGMVHLDFLLLDGETLAGVYGYRYNGRYSFYLPGFNPTLLPQASPGILLLFHCIKEAIREGNKEFDLLRGTADYKMAWANGLRRSLTLRHYNRHVRTAVAKLLESGKTTVKVLVR